MWDQRPRRGDRSCPRTAGVQSLMRGAGAWGPPDPVPSDGEHPLALEPGRGEASPCPCPGFSRELGEVPEECAGRGRAFAPATGDS